MLDCPSCHAENPQRAKFCLECGGALSAVEAERRERRVVSVLMVDLQGFTSRSEQLDIEDVDAFLAPYRARLSQAVARTGGVVCDFAGDGMMAVFGAPVAHEDDPERAVRAAIAIRDQLLDPESSADLHVRLGITTGETLITVGSDQVRATGDVVNTAARLEAAAPRDGILVDEATHRAVDRAIALEPSEPVIAKGKTEPVSAWVVIDARSVVPEQTRLEGLSLVGRRSERTLLASTFDQALADPSTQLVSIVGEPGIGKSRLVEELAVHVDARPDLVTWRVGRSLPYGEGVSFWAIAEMVKSQAGLVDSDSAEITVEKLERAVAAAIDDEHDRAWVVRNLRPLVGLGTGAEGGGQVEAFAAWRRLFEALAESGPTVLVFEDIHWAEDALLDFIDLLADRAGAVPLLIVCTARPELLDRRSGWGGGKMNAHTIGLAALSRAETAEVIAQTLDQALLPADLQATLLARSEGNPLYAQEFVRMLRDRELLVAGPGGWTLTGETEELPESIHGIIAARLDTLDVDEKRLLQAAAVLGRSAWLGGVCALSELSEWQADEILHRLERRRLVQRQRRSSIDGETEFSFGHALTRDVAYAQIARPGRAALHEAAAAWLEESAGQGTERAELIADHYQQAIELRTAMGTSIDSLTRQAFGAFTRAAAQAAAAHATASADGLYQRALELDPADDPGTTADLWLGLILVQESLGTVDRARLEDALTAQVRAERWLGAARVESALATWEEDHGTGAGADEALSSAARYAARMPPSEVSLYVASNQAYRLAVGGFHAEALDLATRELARADAALFPADAGALLQWRGLARVLLGDPAGCADVAEAADILERVGHPRAGFVRYNLAEAERAVGDMDAANRAYIASAASAERFGQGLNADMIFGEQAYQAFHAGDWAQARRLAGEMVLVAESPKIADVNASVQGELDLGADDLAGAATRARALRRYGVEAGNIESQLYGMALEARCRLQSADPVGASTVCDEFLANRTATRIVELCWTAVVLAHLDRHVDIRAAAEGMSEGFRWRQPLLQLADRDYAGAAEAFLDIGSLPLAAEAHLLAGNVDAVERFADRVGSPFYRRRAEEASVAIRAVRR